MTDITNQFEENRVKQAVKDALADKAILDLSQDAVKKAVKETLTDKAIEGLGVQLTNLSSQMTKGFAEVHTRQDTANGKLMSHDIKILAIESKSNYDKLIWLLVTTLLGVVVYFITKTYN